MNVCLNWFEIPAVKFDRAKNFYEQLFNTTLSVCGDKSEKMGFFPRTEHGAKGAISLSKNFEPSLQGVIISFEVDTNLNDVLNYAEQIGGTILKEKTKIEGEEEIFFALIKDTEGNRIGLHAKN